MTHYDLKLVKTVSWK